MWRILGENQDEWNLQYPSALVFDSFYSRHVQRQQRPLGWKLVCGMFSARLLHRRRGQGSRRGESCKKRSGGCDETVLRRDKTRTGWQTQMIKFTHSGHNCVHTGESLRFWMSRLIWGMPKLRREKKKNKNHVNNWQTANEVSSRAALLAGRFSHLTSFEKRAVCWNCLFFFYDKHWEGPALRHVSSSLFFSNRLEWSSKRCQSLQRAAQLLALCLQPPAKADGFFTSSEREVRDQLVSDGGQSQQLARSRDHKLWEVSVTSQRAWFSEFLRLAS